MADKFIGAKERLGLAGKIADFNGASRRVFDVAGKLRMRDVFPEKEI
ncbi:MAG: hypothetical protein MJ165_02200 [Alphaproteobacteria bacterium]|nr:hypothetical protein [Alphaproteobacteria bacterium]